MTDEGERLTSGEAWRDFCERLKTAGDGILADGFPDTPAERAEGFRWLTRLVTHATQLEVETNVFNTHNRRVLEHAEQDESFKKRLLVWRAEEGWEPICKALNLPIPDVPFPHKNKRTEYHGY